MTVREAMARLFRTTGIDAATAEQFAAMVCAHVDDVSFVDVAQALLAQPGISDSDRASIEQMLRDMRGATVQ
jgi:predicted RNA binding protein with dsRBD fold (UPF0201 family)